MTESRHGHLIERAARQLQGSQLHALGAVAPPSQIPPGAFLKPTPILSKVPDIASPDRPTDGAASPVLVDLATLQRAGLAEIGAHRSQAVEEWRIVARTLMRTQAALGEGTKMRNVLMITSSRPGEGKSFCSLNLAATIAQSRLSQVMLVDLDAKPGALSELLGLADRPGLFDLVTQPSLAVADLIVPSAISNLKILPLGCRAALPTGAESGVTQPVVAMLERLSRQFADWLLILDTSPCLATSDAPALAPMVGQIAMVVEAEHTQKNQVEAALGLLDTCEAIAIVLNKTRAQTPGHFGADYYRYYGQGG